MLSQVHDYLIINIVMILKMQKIKWLISIDYKINMKQKENISKVNIILHLTIDKKTEAQFGAGL